MLSCGGAGGLALQAQLLLCKPSKTTLSSSTTLTKANRAGAAKSVQLCQVPEPRVILLRCSKKSFSG